MKRFLVVAEILLACAVLHGQTTQYQRIAGYCEQGGYTIEVGAGVSNTYVQQSFPNCTVTIYYHGTTTLASIYSDNNGDTQANPFAAASDGSWFFYGPNTHYDVRFSGNGITTPFIRSDVFPGPNPKPLGGIAVQQLAAPGVPTVTVFGSTGSTTWAYQCTALDISGETTGSTAATLSNGNATLSNLNYNAVSCPVVIGAVSYNIYRTTAGGTPSSTGLIGNIQQGQTFNDTGGAASGTIATVNTTGQISGIGKLPDIGAQVFNVKAYGAKGDGITDDTAAFNSVLAAATTDGGGVLYFPPGTYNLKNPNSFVSGFGAHTIVSVACASPTSTEINFTGSSGFLLSNGDIYSPYFGGFVRDCKFEMGNGSPGIVGLHLIDSGGWVIQNNSFGSASGISAVGIEFENKTQWNERHIVENNEFYALSPGIEFICDVGGQISFGYNRLLHDQFQLAPNSTGILIQGDGGSNGYFYSGQIDVNANFSGAGTGNVLLLTQGAGAQYDTVNIRTEGGGASNSAACTTGTAYLNESTLGLWANTPMKSICSGSNITAGIVAAYWPNHASTTWTAGSGVPSGSCQNGSLFSNTSGTTGTTLYACVSGAWVDVK